MTTHEYAFDATLVIAVRVRAASEEEARAMLQEALDCASVAFDVAGEGVVAEASLDGELDLYEIDEEPVS